MGDEDGDGVPTVADAENGGAGAETEPKAGIPSAAATPEFPE